MSLSPAAASSWTTQVKLKVITKKVGGVCICAVTQLFPFPILCRLLLQIPAKARKITLTVKSAKDLNRLIRLTDRATVKIPQISFELALTAFCDKTVAIWLQDVQVRPLVSLAGCSITDCVHCRKRKARKWEQHSVRCSSVALYSAHS